MPFTVADFHDLVRLLEEHPDWRTELRRVLLSQDLLDLPRTVQELAIAQRRTEEALSHLIQRMEQGFADAAEDRQRIRDRMEQGFAAVATEQRSMRRDIGQLKGMGQEQFYRDRAAAIFGRLLAQGYDATQQVADALQEARRTGVIADRDYQDVLAADLLWGGQLRDSRQPIVLVLEASWAVVSADVERAARRASVLRQAGLRAIPAAAGQQWSPTAKSRARQAGVVIVQDGTVDQDSWDAALARS
jgi:hypothetical protein